MNLLQLTGPALNGILLTLNLTAAASEVEVQKAVADMVQLNLSLSTEVANLKLAANNAQTALEAFKNQQNEAKVIALVDGAITEKKILPGQKETYIKLANADFDSTKSILDGLTAAKSVREQIELTGGSKTELDALIALSYDELWSSGKMERLKELSNDAYLDKRAEKFPLKAVKK